MPLTVSRGLVDRNLSMDGYAAAVDAGVLPHTGMRSSQRELNQPINSVPSFGSWRTLNREISSPPCT